MRAKLYFCCLTIFLLGCERIDADRAADLNVKPDDSAVSSSSASSTSPTSSPAPAGPQAPDNTAVNQRDATGDTKTAIDQKETQRDVNITAEIRKRVIAAEGMSVNARNVKIITEDGQVVLRGPVNTAAEKEAIDKFARDVAGDQHVDNQIEVLEAKKPTDASPDETKTR